MKGDTVNTDTLFSAGFWERAWAEVHRSSFLQASQKTHPERWYRFYEDAGSLLRVVSGLAESQGETLVAGMGREGLIAPGQSVVDLGCGTGWLALPLAKKGASVLAVDQSPNMIQAVRDAAARRKLPTVTPRESFWTELQLPEPLDLALAAFFPEVLSPDGFRRMESLGRSCAVILGGGIKTLPWTEPLWRELVGSVPSGGAHQAHAALNWLLAANRRPNLRHLTLNFSVDQPLETLLTFYHRYFAIYGCEGRSINAVLNRVLEPFASKGRIRARGQTHLSLTWWISSEGDFGR